MWSLVQYAPVLVILVAVATLLWKFPVQTATSSAGLAIALDCFDVGRQGFDLGVSIYSDDIACVILLCAGCISIMRWQKRPSRDWWFALGLFSLTIFNLVRGASEFGLKPAGNGIRGLVYLIIPPIALMLLRPAIRLDPIRLAKWLTLAGVAFAAIGLCRWAGILPSPEWTSQENLREIPRVLNAEYAMVLGQALLAVLGLQIARGFKWWGLVLAGSFGTELLFLQHRSVWVATTVGLIWLIIRTVTLSKRLWVGAAAGAFLAVGIWSALTPGALSSVRGLIEANVEETQRSDSSWAWRTSGYEEAVNRTLSGTTEEVLLGPPAGRNLGASANLASVSIHDRYVDTLAYYGIFGEVLLVAWLLLVAKSAGGWLARQRHQSRDRQLGIVFLQALLLSELTFFIPYTGGLPVGISIGLIWVLSTKRPPNEKAARFVFPLQSVESS